MKRMGFFKINYNFRSYFDVFKCRFQFPSLIYLKELLKFFFWNLINRWQFAISERLMQLMAKINRHILPYICSYYLSLTHRCRRNKKLKIARQNITILYNPHYLTVRVLQISTVRTESSVKGNQRYLHSYLFFNFNNLFFR